MFTSFMVLMTSNSFLFLAGLQTILMATFVFTLVILALSLMLIVARQKLVAQGDVKIIINGNEDAPLLVKQGSSLLSSLADNNIFLPSACGGGGTCAMCECHVSSGVVVNGYSVTRCKHIVWYCYRATCTYSNELANI